MEAMYLRHREGAPVGPITRVALELLFDARLVDGLTPVSLDGTAFRPLSEHVGLLEQLEAAKARASAGDDPWPEAVAVRPDPGPGAPRGAAQWVLAIGSGRETGVLSTPEGAMVFRSGRLVEVRSDSERLLRWMVDRQRIPATFLSAARDGEGVDLGEALVGGGAIGPDDYVGALGAWALERLAEVFLDADPGKLSFETREVDPPPLSLRLGRLSLVAEAVRTLAAERLEAHLRPSWGCPVIPSQVDGVEVEALELRPKELRAMRLMNGARTVGEVVEACGGSEDALRAVFVGVATGLRVLGEDPEASRRAAREREDALRLEEAEAFLRSLEAKRLHEVLGVDEGVGEDEVRARYAEMARIHHPDTLGADASAELKAVKAAITQRLNEAFETLTEPVPEKSPEERAEEAETALKKAEILFRMKKYPEALEEIARALERVPDSAAALAFRAWTKYQAACRSQDPASAAPEAIDEIKAALKRDAELVQAHIWLGHLYKTTGDERRSLNRFKRALSIDESNAEASREVRLANARAEKAKKKLW